MKAFAGSKAGETLYNLRERPSWAAEKRSFNLT
jgi:hypothetical protein